MNMNYKKLTLLFCILSWTLSSIGQGEVYDEKKLSRSYVATKGSYVELSNRYGDIEIVPWAKDSVKIQVVIRTYSEKYDWRQTMMESIHVDFTRTSGFIIAETNWKEDASIWRKSTYNVSKELGSNRIEVNYKVYLPATIPLEISNKFGNVFMGSHDGELDIVVQHGDFRARDLKNVKRLEVRYGKVKVKSITKGQIDLGSGSSLDLDEGGDIMLSSSSSEIEIDEVATLNVTSRHDDIFVNVLDKVYGSFNLSDLKIGTLNKELRASTKFGTLRVMQVAQGAERVSIDGSKTQVILGLAPGFSGRFDLDVDGEGELSLPKDMNVAKRAVTEDKRLSVQGTMGAQGGTIVSISSASGFVQIGD
jgi:hypothetical protein